MVCSACGFENDGEMRYCGMCGMPLPHRPLTTPGAQSTLTLPAFRSSPAQLRLTHPEALRHRPGPECWSRRPAMADVNV